MHHSTVLLAVAIRWRTARCNQPTRAYTATRAKHATHQTNPAALVYNDVMCARVGPHSHGQSLAVGAVALAVLGSCGRVDFVARGGNDAAQADASRDASAADASPILPVVATLTVDNAFSFMWDDSSARMFMQGKTSPSIQEIFDCPVGFGPAEFSIPVPVVANRYLYIAAWADASTQAGFLGKFVRAGKTTLTGDAAWEVCAVGESYGLETTGPTAARIYQAIEDCNAGINSASKGWLNMDGPVTPAAQGLLYVGDRNDGSGIWNLTCQNDNTGRGIPQAARWIWWDPDDGLPQHDNTGNRTQTFQLFRIASTAL